MFIVFREMLEAVGYLSSKDNKTDREENIIKAFHRSLRVAFIIPIVGALFLGIAVMSFVFSMPYGDKIYGTVEGGDVRYRTNDVEYVSLSELNISLSDVVEGDSIILWLDSIDGEILKSIPEDSHNNKTNMYLVIIFSLTIILVIISVVASRVIPKTVGKEFYDWYHNEYGNEVLKNG